MRNKYFALIWIIIPLLLQVTCKSNRNNYASIKLNFTDNSQFLYLAHDLRFLIEKKSLADTLKENLKNTNADYITILASVTIVSESYERILNVDLNKNRKIIINNLVRGKNYEIQSTLFKISVSNNVPKYRYYTYTRKVNLNTNIYELNLKHKLVKEDSIIKLAGYVGALKQCEHEKNCNFHAYKGDKIFFRFCDPLRKTLSKQSYDAVFSKKLLADHMGRIYLDVPNDLDYEIFSLDVNGNKNKLISCGAKLKRSEHGMIDRHLVNGELLGTSAFVQKLSPSNKKSLFPGLKAETKYAQGLSDVDNDGLADLLELNSFLSNPFSVDKVYELGHEKSQLKILEAGYDERLFFSFSFPNDDPNISLKNIDQLSSCISVQRYQGLKLGRDLAQNAFWDHNKEIFRVSAGRLPKAGSYIYYLSLSSNNKNCRYKIKKHAFHRVIVAPDKIDVSPRLDIAFGHNGYLIENIESLQGEINLSTQSCHNATTKNKCKKSGEKCVWNSVINECLNDALYKRVYSLYPATYRFIAKTNLKSFLSRMPYIDIDTGYNWPLLHIWDKRVIPTDSGSYLYFTFFLSPWISESIEDLIIVLRNAVNDEGTELRSPFNIQVYPEPVFSFLYPRLIKNKYYLSIQVSGAIKKISKIILGTTKGELLLEKGLEVTKRMEGVLGTDKGPMSREGEFLSSAALGCGKYKIKSMTFYNSSNSKVKFFTPDPSGKHFEGELLEKYKHFSICN